MNPTIEELHQPEKFELIEALHVDQMGQFLMREIGMSGTKAGTKPKMNWVGIGAAMALGGVCGFIGYKFGANLATGGILDYNPGVQLGAALLLMFVVLLPVHEAIHMVVFKQLGAKNVGFGWSKKSLIVYAYAQKFVMTLQQNAYVAIMPFVVISLALAIGWLVAPQWSFFWGCALFLHTTACVGDFILIRYYFKNKPNTLYTYDDIEGKKMSYFFVAKKQMS